MDSFSISELERFSGVKAHTIRIWEKRYKALKPARSDGNTRVYDSSQLKRLLNISALLDSDYKISDLCAMPDQELKSLHGKMFEESTAISAEYFISQLIASAVTFDEAQFIHVFSNCLLRYGLKQGYLQVLYPALTRIGLMWMNDSLATANEHFVSNMIRQKLSTAIDSLPPAKSGTECWVLFLPENEFHEIGLLMACYLIRLSGQKVIYLGANVPELAVKEAVTSIKPNNILMFYVHNDLPANINDYLDRLNKELSVKHIYVAAKQKMTYPLKKNTKVHFLQSVTELDILLAG